MSSEAPSRVTAAVREVEETDKSVKRVNSEFENLRKIVNKEQQQIEPIKSCVQEKIDKVEQLEKLSSYLKCIHTIHSLR